MNSAIQSLVPKEDRARVAEIVEKSDFLLDILAKVCYNIIRESQNITKSDYSSPSWSHEQAHRNGKVEALTDFLKIINKYERT
tara:strand:+ start:853 stop:1101 length:249 start_codon:yes stop_codon:yes gene_type:complete